MKEREEEKKETNKAGGEGLFIYPRASGRLGRTAGGQQGRKIRTAQFEQEKPEDLRKSRPY